MDTHRSVRDVSISRQRPIQRSLWALSFPPDCLAAAHLLAALLTVAHIVIHGAEAMTILGMKASDCVLQGTGLACNQIPSGICCYFYDDPSQSDIQAVIFEHLPPTVAPYVSVVGGCTTDSRNPPKRLSYSADHTCIVALSATGGFIYENSMFKRRSGSGDPTCKGSMTPNSLYHAPDSTGYWLVGATHPGQLSDLQSEFQAVTNEEREQWMKKHGASYFPRSTSS